VRSAEAQAVLAEIRATWPNREIDEAQGLVWMDTLAPIGIDSARSAVRFLRQTKDFPPSHHEFLVAAQEQGRRLAAENSLGDGEAGPCRECGDDQWVTLGHPSFGQTPTVRPCSRCMPVQFVRWSEGHLASGHKCSECVDLVRGSAETRREVTSAIRGRAVPVDLDPLF
jgi:hypothetical protein